jgi:hypothetical protein
MKSPLLRRNKTMQLPERWELRNGQAIQYLVEVSHGGAIVEQIASIRVPQRAALITAAPELFNTVDTLCNGLEWLIENHPTIMNEADNEAVTAARALLARIHGE